MDSIELILVARAVHVVAGVAWAGFVMLGVLLVPLVAMRDEAAAQSVRQAMAIGGQLLAGPAALLTVLSGIYLMAVLHPGDQSMTGFALRVGALAGVSSIVLGAALIGPRSRKLARLHLGAQPIDPLLQRRLRSTLSLAAKLNGVVMLVAVLAMATARYL
ncbi:MAG: hypothetical protein JWM77_891 [Rhodospirillales bacterium]|jgi:hypothetical protein|nr:hypothetical protein [Rhodospirillales bacterium]